jgi:hypothetical protein
MNMYEFLSKNEYPFSSNFADRVLQNFFVSADWEIFYRPARSTFFFLAQVLIYVFDVESRELEKDIHYYQSCLEAILQNSPEVGNFFHNNSFIFVPLRF